MFASPPLAAPQALDPGGGSGSPTQPRRRHVLLDRLLLASWRRGLAVDPPLDPDALIRAARARTGLDDLGDPAVWHASLAVLTRAIAEESALSPLGRVIAHGQLVGALADRLRAHALWRRHPEIADQPIRAPIAIVGQMRSGTTRMQRLLACDPAFAHTRFFEGFNPVPTGRWGGLDDRRLRARAGLFATRLINPDFAVIHPTAVTAPDEEVGLHSIGLFGSAFEAQWRVPGYARHVETMDARPVYAEFRRLLRTIAWLRGEDGTQPLILKMPQLTQDLPALIATFPDVRLICLRRDAAAIVASSASLTRNQMEVQSRSVDPHWIGRETLRKVRLRHHRTQAARAAAPHVPQIDIDFAAMSEDWRGQMRRVYALLERDLTPRVEARMASYLARAARAPLHRHRYALADFGLNEAAVAEVVPHHGDGSFAR